MSERLQRFIGNFVIIVGAAVLAGWWLGIALLRSIAPGLPEMVPNTALAFVLAGLALRSSTRRNHTLTFIARVSALAIVSLGLLTSLEYVYGLDFGIDRLLMPGRGSDGRSSLSGRMSPHTAANFVLAGTALLLASTNKRRMIHLSQMLAATAAAIALVALVGYVYGVTALYGISPQTGMALHTALLFLILSAGILLLHPAHGVMRIVTSEGLGGIVARRLLAAAFVVPLVLGWLSVLGQQAGLYDAALSSSLLVVGSIFVFSTLIWSGARTLDRIDGERRVAEEGRAQLLRRVIDAQEEERRRLARELHDQMGQHLAALMLQLELHRADAGANDGGGHLRQVHELADRLAHEAHTLAWELRPPELDQLGLQAALARYAEQWSRRAGVKADFVATGLTKDRLPPETEIALYRVVQEALTNVLKHAGAANVSVVVERRSDEVRLIVEDDGGGFDTDALDAPTPSARRLGVLGMRERIDAVGGKLDIESSPGAGATLVVRVPLTNKVESPA